jgi:hypothetical protein
MFLNAHMRTGTHKTHKKSHPADSKQRHTDTRIHKDPRIHNGTQVPRAHRHTDTQTQTDKFEPDRTICL